MEYKDLLKLVSGTFKKPEIKAVIKAYEFAAKAHKNQVRASGEPYIIHPTAIAASVFKLLPDPTLVQAALLHDVIEDTDVTYEDIFSKFGQEVADIVNGVTKISKFKFNSAAENQAENTRKILIAMSRDIRVVIVKIADRLHNMRTLEFLPAYKQKQIARSTLDLYAPLAHRLGIGGMKDELEDLAFKYLYPNEYFDILKNIENREVKHEEYLNKVIDILQKTIKENHIKARVKGRAKHLFSIFQKMRRDSKKMDEIFDIAGVRIITSSVRDCYGVMGIVHSLWPPVPGRIKDYIATPKSNMYQSIHTTVIGPEGEFVEIQIRTEEMDRIAGQGIAAHWAYKERLTHDKSGKKFMWLTNIMDWQESYKDPQEFMEALKIDLFPDSVFVFTPRGDVKELPRDSTVIDFAYAIHTVVGNTCVGAKINGKIVPLNYKVKTGDVAEIITLKGHEPSIDWLKMVRTPRALNRIRQFLKLKQTKENITIGRNILESKLKAQNVSLNAIEKGDTIKGVLKAFKLSENNELYFAVGAAKLSVNSVIRQILKSEKKAEPVIFKQAQSQSRKTAQVVIAGMGNNVLLNFAKCCKPIPGDNILGYITRGRGITIHKDTCKNVKYLLKDPARIVPAQWSNSSKTLHIISLIIKSLDREGLLADVANVLKETGVNVLKADVTTAAGNEATLSLRIEVYDAEHLNRVIERIKEIKDVTRIIRK